MSVEAKLDNPNNQDKPDRGAWARRLGGVLLLLLFVAIGASATRTQLAGFITGQGNLGEFVILYSISSVFFISYIAYRAFQSPSRLIRLRNDFSLLGIENPEESYWRAQSAGNYILNITLATAFTAIGLGLFFWPPGVATAGSTQPLIDVNALQAMRFGFLGAYVFSIQLIYRRYTTFDIQPAVYLYCAFVIAMGMIFNYIAFEALANLASSTATEPVTGIGAGLLAILAFSLGYFPYLAINWFNRVSYRALGVDQRRADALPLGLVDGISPFHEVRLRDNGIDNIQNLAAVDIGSLLLNSTFSAQQVIDWVDQSILYLYVDPGTAESFRRAGVRCASDFNDLWERAGRDEHRGKVADQMQSTVERLDTLHAALLQGPNLHYVLRYWSNADIHARAQTRTYLDKRLSEVQRDAVQNRTNPERRRELLQQDERLRHEMAGWGIEPSRPESAEALVGQGVLCQEAGQNDKAIEAYRLAIENDPQYAEAYNSLAWLLVNENKDLDEALKLAQTAVNLQQARPQEESYAAYLDTLATVQIKQNQLVDAEKNLQEARKVSGLSDTGKQYIDQHLKDIQQLRARDAVMAPAPQPNGQVEAAVTVSGAPDQPAVDEPPAI